MQLANLFDFFAGKTKGIVFLTKTTSDVRSFVRSINQFDPQRDGYCVVVIAVPNSKAK